MMNAYPTVLTRKTAAFSFKLYWLSLFSILFGVTASAQSSLQVNFQDSATTTPVGWLKDYGQPFGARTSAGQGTGNSYGWKKRADNTPLDLTAYGRRRSAPSDVVLATLMHMQYTNTLEGIWEAQVANGTYDVTVSVGDNNYLDSKHSINIEGVPAIVGFVPTSTTKFKSATVTVSVTDGLLTMDASGGTNTKVNYISIKPSTTGSDTTNQQSVVFNQSSESAEVEQGGTQSLLEYISTTDSKPVSATLSATDVNGKVPDWLSVNGKLLDGTINYTTGSEITFTFDATNLSIGKYTARVIASATGYNKAVLDISLTVKAGTNGTPANLQVNFQDSVTKTPVGWLKDYGQPFGARTSANQGSGNVYGWIKRSDNTPLNMTAYGRKRTAPADTLLATLIHMQPNSTTEGIWEAQVANGNYDVTVSVGDNDYLDSKHSINIEGVPAIVGFVPTSTTKFKSATVSVSVADGLLTMDAIGGTNTKVNYISIKPSTTSRPSVVLVNPENGSQNVSENTSISTSILNLPNGGINNETLTSTSVYLSEDGTGVRVPAHVNGTGGGDAITLVPDAPLKLNTTYVFTITDSVKDLSGASFIPYSSNFTTNSVSSSELLNVKFDQVQLPNTVGRHSSLTIGPDGKLYALSIDGVIKRFGINPDGTLTGPELLYSLQDAYGSRQQRLAVGFAFDPKSTASNLIAWVTHDSYLFLNAPDWDGKLTKLSGPNLENVQDVLINLPRSAKDHVTNSVAFGPDGALYFTQGSTSAMGKADQTWGNRSEHLLNAAVLRLDVSKLGTLPLNVKTKDGGGTYDPYAANAPLTIYASGVRNAYDLVWHSNGELYVATNGSAAGGNTPASVNGTLRPDGTTYNGPSVPALSNVQQTMKDFLFRVKKGGYYGHPNPLRGEYVMNGGNPTTAIDPSQVDAYPVGTQPDPNWRGYAFDFQANKSPNGSIEYKSNTFNGALKGKIMVVRYSQNDDIITLTPGGTNNDIVSYSEGASIRGFTGFIDPLDLTEDTKTGNIYVSEYGGDGKITLLRPNTNGMSPSNITVFPKKIYDNDVAGGTAGTNRVITIKNASDTSVLAISGISLTGANADQFILSNLPAFPKNINPKDSVTITVAFNPVTTGLKTASVDIISNDAVNSTVSVALRGLGTPGLGGSNEPSLQALMNLYELPVSVGDDDVSTAVINSNTTVQKAPLLGDEISMQKFVKADTGAAVTIEPLAIFSPTANNPVLGMGWYKSGNSTSAKELFTVTNNPVTNGQTVNVNFTGTLSFDPGTSAFGFYSRWPFFNNRYIYSEDSLNTFAGSVPHHVRVYPYKNSSGIVPNAYIVAFEETTSALDYQDLIFVVRNVKADAGTVTTLLPIADAYVRDGTYATKNYGTDTSLVVKGSVTSNYTRNTFLKFSLANVSSVGSAKLRIYGRNTENTTLVNVTAYNVNDDSWGENTITWNNAPASGTSNLGSVGINNNAQYYELDVTNFIKTELSGDKVASLVLKDPAIMEKSVFLNSRENAQNQPQLVISSAAPATSNTLLFVENLDKFPSNDHFVTSRIQTPWTRDTVAPYTYNANHDTARIRIHNKGIYPLVISNFILSNNSNWRFLKLKGMDYNPATALPLTINPGAYADLTLQFVALDQATRVKVLLDYLTIVSNDDKFPNKVLNLHGLWQKKGEGSNEPYAQEIINTFGYKTKTGFSHTDPDLGDPSKPKGDEIITSYFVRADTSKPVYIRQMSAYHSCCTFTETIRWYTKGTTTYNSIFTHKGVDGQSILPRKSLPNTPADGSINPTDAFGLKVAGSYYMDTLKNYQHKLSIRIYKAIDANGYVIPNTYILCHDYIGTDITNYDYQDNVYYITNVKPETGSAYYSELGSTPSAVDFGEKLLGTANTFKLNLKNLGKTYTNGTSDPAISISSIAIAGDNSTEFTAFLPTKTTLSPQDTTNMTIGFNPSSEGLKIADLLIYYNNSKSPYRVPLYGIGKAVGTTVTAVYRIKAGSSSSITVNGNTWSADTAYAFDNLEPFSNPQVTQIAATDDDVLYLREQSSNADKKPFRYEMPIANGNYIVRLHFAELYWGDPGGGLNGGPGSRVMSVSLENQLRLINFDVAAEVGSASAVIKNVPVTVTDGKLNIDFSAMVNRPMVNAIEVYKFSNGTSSNVANSKISLQDLSTANNFEKPKVYPNPLKERFYIQFPSVYKGNVALQLVDAFGREYELGQVRLQAGGSNMEVNISKLHLGSGIYFLKIYAENRKPQVVKLLIE